MPNKTVAIPDSEGNEHVVDVDTLRWRPSAYGIVIKDGALLLSPQFDGYDLPGGGVELGETPEEAVMREVREETGIMVANPRLLIVETSYFRLPESVKDRDVQSLLMYYVCDYVGGELSDSGFMEYEKVYTHFPEWYPLQNGAVDLKREQIASSYDWRELVTKVGHDK